MKAPPGWRKREHVAARTYYTDEYGVERIADETVEEDFVCLGCQQGHAFKPETTDAEIRKFLKGHEHGDGRLTPDYPEELRDLTLAQIADRDNAVWQTMGLPGPGPKETQLIIDGRHPNYPPGTNVESLTDGARRAALAIVNEIAASAKDQG